MSRRPPWLEWAPVGTNKVKKFSESMYLIYFKQRPPPTKNIYTKLKRERSYLIYTLQREYILLVVIVSTDST